jgi:hypothetical protein
MTVKIRLSAAVCVSELSFAVFCCPSYFACVPGPVELILDTDRDFKFMIRT